MANRAYLFSDDRPDAWDMPEEDYYDSRWTIPLAWFFFFGPDDVRLVDEHFGGSSWQEVRFSASKRTALELFSLRLPLLLSMIGDRLEGAAVQNFLSKVVARPGQYLLMNPTEVLEDEEHAQRIAVILAALGSGSCTTDAARELLSPYAPDFDLDPDRCEVQILGYTYW